MHTDADVFVYLYQNRNKFKEDLAEYTKQREELLQKEDKVFHTEIEAQYADILRKMIMMDVARNLTCGADVILEIVEALDVVKYIKE